MSHSPVRRKVAALALAGLCLAPWLAASETRPGPVARSSSAVAEAPWSPVARLWSSLVSLWAGNGCSIDPSGRCLPTSGTGGSGQEATVENGCSIDPDGCARTVPVDNGCSIDPDGCSR